MQMQTHLFIPLTFYCVPFILTNLACQVTRFPANTVFVLVHRYSSIDALRATFIHNCCCLFVQAPFLVQGCAILQNLLYFIATVILNLHALTMCCGQKFTNHVAAKAISYKHMFWTPAFTGVHKDRKAFFNFTLYIQGVQGEFWPPAT